MRKRKIVAAVIVLLTIVGVAYAQRRMPRFFPFQETDDAPMPADAGGVVE